MQRRTFSRPETMFLLGIPLAWAILLLFHPGGDPDTIYQDISDQVTAWMVVHIGTMLFIPLMAVVIFVLLRGFESTAAQVSRIAAIVFAVFYGGFEAGQGIANGILVNEVNDLPASERATGSQLIQDFAENILIRDLGVFASIGSVALVTAMVSAGLALRREAGASTVVVILLVIAGLLITAHPPPFGPAGLALFIVAVVLFMRSQSAAPAPAPLGQPGSG